MAVRKSSPGSGSAELRETARQLNSSAIHLLRSLRGVDKEAGLTPARLSALSVLVFSGPTPLGRLARIEGVASPTMTRIVDGLCDLGLAVRSQHPDLNTVVLVSATSAGEDLMSTAAERRFGVIADGLAALSPTDRRAVEDAAPALLRLAQLLRGPVSG